MARGFEVKSVQEAWQDAEAASELKKRKKKTHEEIELETQRESLELSRRRVVHDLETTNSDRRREQLRAALAYLDSELAKLNE